MAEINAMIEIRHNNDLRNRVMRTINARLFPLDDGTGMIQIDDIIATVPDQKAERRRTLMEIIQLRDLLGQLGYTLMKSEDAQEIIQQYNEDADPPRCPECGHEMKSGEGWQCAGYVCPECGHEDEIEIFQCQMCGCTLDGAGLDQQQKYVCEDCRARNPAHLPALPTAQIA